MTPDPRPGPSNDGETADLPAPDDGPPRGGWAKGRGGLRVRRCLASGESGPETGMVRFVADPDSMIVPDLAARLPGRGAWVSANRTSLETVIKKRLFARSLKQAVRVSDDLVDTVERLLAQRFFDGLGVARRAGALVTGFETVCETLRKGEPVFLLEASDGAVDGRQKIVKLAAKAAPGSLVAAFGDAARFGAALGLGHAVHGAVLAGRHGERAVRDAGRLSGFRAAWPWPDPPPDGLRTASLGVVDGPLDLVQGDSPTDCG